MEDEATRRWEDMDTDCLVQIFGRLGLGDTATAVPFVCRSWRRASLDPVLWRALDFRHLDFMPWSGFAKSFASLYAVRRLAFSGFLRLCVARSKGAAALLALPPLLGAAAARDLDYISDRCPRLRNVVLPKVSSDDEARLPAIVAGWRDLEHLEIEAKPSCFVEMVTQIGLNCRNFSGLKMAGSIKREDAMAIAMHLPRLKSLCLDKSYLPKQELLVMVSGCRDLENLSARNCVGFDEGDEEVVKKASWIDKFEHGGSRLAYEFDHDIDECDPLHVHVI